MKLFVYLETQQDLICKMALISNGLYALIFIGLIVLFTTNVTAKRLCGTELAEQLKAICKNNYNGFGRLTASIRDEFNERSIFAYQSVPFISKLTGGLLSPRIRRKRSGVSDECCKKPCTFKELANYCL